ncbi:MAG: hypothetical protein CO129_12330 [Ignavibacteriales bacterium CG_4_9_14_3_um_filter_34_10]|nr:MAG: hypothetical protein CO129_12330 [Ignavibacteriales bacterium CG_4_9_14_3_um_filter_34_10]
MMNILKAGMLLVLFWMTFVVAQTQNSVFVTAYNNNLGVIRDIRTINLEKGKSKITLTDVAELIDPTSVHIKLNANVLEQNFQYDLVSLSKILLKYIDNDIRLIAPDGNLTEGKLLSAFGNQIVLQKNDGGLIMIPNVDKYTLSVNSLPEGLITKPSLIWSIESQQTGKQKLEITYQTNGINWHAEYVAVLNKDDSMLDLNSWVSIENQSGASYKDAKLKLVAGDVNLVQAQQPRFMGMRKEMALADAAPQFEEKEFFEYHIYDLQRPTTLSNNETKQISLFESSNIKAEKKYLYSNFYSFSRGSSQKVKVIMEFENTEKNKLGMPFPKGKVRVYKSDGKTSEFVGEDLIDHTPKDEKIKLTIGNAFDIIVEDVQKENNRITDKVYEQVWEIKIKNRKNENIVVEVERNLGSNWEIKNSNISYDKKNSQQVTFLVPIKANNETLLKYNVRYNY